MGVWVREGERSARGRGGRATPSLSLSLPSLSLSLQTHLAPPHLVRQDDVGVPRPGVDQPVEALQLVVPQLALRQVGRLGGQGARPAGRLKAHARLFDRQGRLAQAGLPGRVVSQGGRAARRANDGRLRLPGALLVGQAPPLDEDLAAARAGRVGHAAHDALDAAVLGRGLLLHRRLHVRPLRLLPGHGRPGGGQGVRPPHVVDHPLVARQLGKGGPPVPGAVQV